MKMYIFLYLIVLIVFQDGRTTTISNTCNPIKVSVCSKCTGSGLNPKCAKDEIGPFCFKQHTYTSSGVVTVKGAAQESDCRANISRSHLVDPNCNLSPPPTGTVCYECCVSCDLHDRRCNDADVIDSRHIPTFVHQAAHTTATTPKPVSMTTNMAHPTMSPPTDQTHITSANRHEPICQSGNIRFGYNVMECPSTHPFCMNDVFYDVGGVDRILDATKRCVSLSECVGEWWHKSKNRRECMTGDLTHLSDGNILCHYCCLSDIAEPCNKDTRLTNNYQFSSLRPTANTVTTPALHVCPAGWFQHSNSCYLFSSENKTWAEAASICQAFHGELAIVETQDENNFLIHHIKSNQGNFQKDVFWLDASDRSLEGHWAWAATLKHLTYSDWYPGQPDNHNQNQDCLTIHGSSNYMWTDENCDSHFHFICERIK